MKRELKTKKLTICMSDNDYNKLYEIRSKSGNSISELIRDSLTFYDLYYNDTEKNKNESL